MQRIPRCRYCRKNVTSVLSLGDMPLVNYFPTKHEAFGLATYPLVLYSCPSCGLMQVGETVLPQQIFTTYHYMTGASQPLVTHFRDLARTCTRRLHLGKGSAILDIGANDGTLLGFFRKRGIGVLGVEPARNIARIAKKRGIPVIEDFFTSQLARRIRRAHGQFDIISATHTLANIPNLADFFRGVTQLLKPDGTLVIEVASCEEMVRNGQFDAIYHEHYWYFTYAALTKVLRDFGFTVTSATLVPVQGGSLLLFANKGKGVRPAPSPTKPLAAKELDQFTKKVMRLRSRLRQLLVSFHGKTVMGFGAPAKAVTLLNFCQLGPSDIQYVVDAIAAKQGRLIPGVNIPVYPEAYVRGRKIDAVLVLAWNYKDAIIEKIRKLVPSRPRIIVPFPTLEMV